MLSNDENMKEMLKTCRVNINAFTLEVNTCFLSIAIFLSKVYVRNVAARLI